MDLAGAAAAFRDLAARAESGLALECCHEAAKDYLTVLRMVTPKRTGKLADSEHIDAVFGDGTSATAVVAPHVIYARFRNDGGTITAKYGEVWKTPRNGTRARMYRHTLHFGDTFALHVTQVGAHYMEKARAEARGPIENACREVLDRFFAL